MSESTIAQLLKVLFGVLKDRRTVTYSNVAALTILWYDTALEMSREVEFIWRAKWSFPKALYIIIRYYGLFHLGLTGIVETRTNIGAKVCRAYIWGISIAGAIVFSTLVNFVLLLRVHAIYGQSRRVLCFLVIVIMAEFATEFYITFKVILGTTFAQIAAIESLFPGCIVQSSELHLTLVCWIPALLISVLFFTMTIWKFYISFRDEQKLTLQWGQALSPMLTAFIRDGTVFFLLIAVVLLACTVTTATLRGPLLSFFVPWLLGVYSFAGSRLILGLREAALKEGNEKTWDAMTLSTAAFNSNRTRIPHDTLSIEVDRYSLDHQRLAHSP
ncbi:hypothetical protein BDZ94DRAFT_99052 [Collybia nuda]|uniref:DUF6533 domain-containing protein n=1 Tax=Collybia nuda TaxID=64659 RepID=A0A9P5YDT9_9AGAR|nr:hypothetical protein BDZ94DRAFT_99052 [Collybia nuda]